ncbi:MAG: hypothetical protein QX197_00935, partial [Methylococcaceae bacterium]
IDAYNAPGVGNMKNDYAQVGFSITDTLGNQYQNGKMVIDIAPVADLGSLALTALSAVVASIPGGLASPTGWHQWTFTTTGASPDTDGSERTMIAIDTTTTEKSYGATPGSQKVAVKSANDTVAHLVTASADGNFYVNPADSIYVSPMMPPSHSLPFSWIYAELHRQEITANGTVLDDVATGVKLNTYLCPGSPLVLDLNGDGVQTTALGNGTHFDLNADGTAINTGWVSKEDGLLALDLNGDGKIDSGAELFGTATQLADGSKAQDGFQALRALDSNGDNKIDLTDSMFAKLLIWQDANSDGVSDTGELHSLSSLNIASLNVANTEIAQVQNGNTLGLLSSFTTTDNQIHELIDVWFATSDAGLEAAATSIAAGNYDAPAISLMGMPEAVQQNDFFAV